MEKFILIELIYIYIVNLILVKSIFSGPMIYILTFESK